ncbi:MAG: phosphate ABC transporter substrate-binding protein [Oscillospiraceae bacterium]|nr:phosphate ABC transporter substrate-binding protein [Oscillospiraceae bacterium]
MKLKKILSMFLAVALLGAGLAGCSSSDNSGGSTSNSSNSSTSDSSASDSGTTTLSGSVSTNGSTSMEEVIGILSEQFMLDNTGVNITYDATGSGTGIEAVSNGTCDIGLSSRDLKDEEVENGLEATTLALDGIAIIVNENSSVTDLTVEQIADIFTGVITDWSELGGSGEIACIGREAGSGTRDGFESITGTTDSCVLAQELTSTGAVIAAVQSSENAIGYASFSAVEGQEGITVLTVGGVACSEDTIADGSYVIQRPFNLVTRTDTALSDAAQAFFDWATSSDAAELISSAGVVPVAG